MGSVNRGQGAHVGAEIVAKGITQQQVSTAADALVAAGERPTVERIRAFLGTGSPNTVTRLLETWWQELGGRLTAQDTKLAMPDAPNTVAALASQLWEQALIAARTEMDQACATERNAIACERQALDAERESRGEEIRAQQATLMAAQQAQAIAEAQLAQTHRLIDQQAQQLTDLTQQRNDLQTQSERIKEELASLASYVQQQEATVTAEREAQVRHLRSVEDRAHAEIDRARQEARELRTQLQLVTRERAKSEQQAARQRDEALAAAALAQREAAVQQARADALEQQLARLGDLPATLQATFAEAHKTRGTAAVPRRPKTPAGSRRKTRTKAAL